MKYLPPLQHGSIKTYPYSTPTTPTKHPPSHKQNNKTYLLPQLSKTPPNRQHFETQIFPTLKTTHPRHQEAIIAYPHSPTYICTHQHPPTPVNPPTPITNITPTRSNQQPSKHLNLEWTTYLLNKMATIRNPPNRHILTSHTYTPITNVKVNIANPPNIMHKRPHNYAQHKVQLNIHTPINESPSPSPPIRHTTKTLTKKTQYHITSTPPHYNQYPPNSNTKNQYNIPIHVHHYLEHPYIKHRPTT